MTFSDNLRAMRRAKEYSQESLAQQLGVTRQTVSKWENGTAMPDLKKLTEIAALFDTTMDALLGTDQPVGDSGRAQTAYDLQTMDVRMEKMQRQTNWLTGMLIVLGVLVIILLILAQSAFSQLDVLQDQIYNLPDTTVVTGSSDDEDTDTPDEYTTATVLKIDPKNPKIATLRLSYAPNQYANGTQVAFMVPAKNGKQTKVPATLKDGTFTAEVTTDVTLGDNWQVLINDGKTTGKWDFYAELAESYLPHVEWSEDLDDVSTNGEYSRKTGYAYSFGSNSQLVSWYATGFLTVDRAHLVGTDQENKVLVDQPLQIVSRGEGNLALVNLPNVTAKAQVQNFRLDFTTKEGVKGTINWQDEAKMILTFPGGGELDYYF